MGLLRPFTLGLLVLGTVAFSQGDTTSPVSSTASDIHHDSTTASSTSKKVTRRTTPRPQTLKEAITCTEKSSEPREGQRGEYHVLYNYVPMNRNVSCWESLTYATNGDFTFLDNLEPLLQRWNAPISVALYAPGTDFQSTLESIKYLRSCSSSLVSELVTFHLYYSDKHVPEEIPSSKDILSATYNCSSAAPWTKVLRNETYKNKNGLIYPINVGRNIAKETALTHYLIVADIELYPSLNLASDFLEMIRRNKQRSFFSGNPHVFVLPPFEVEENSEVPANKSQLVKMLSGNKAFPFHNKLCPECHAVPGYNSWKRWRKHDINLRVVGMPTLRRGLYQAWEPVYIGTDQDPIYDERVSWEGQQDKRIQGWLLCVQDYEFFVLNNAFVVHRPGIKKASRVNPQRAALMTQTQNLINDVILPEYRAQYPDKIWRLLCKV